jgi:hypothetical protein
MSVIGVSVGGFRKKHGENHGKTIGKSWEIMGSKNEAFHSHGGYPKMDGEKNRKSQPQKWMTEGSPMTLETTNGTRRIPRAESIEVLQRYLQEAQCFEVFALPWICLDREIVGFEDPL